MPRSQFLLRIHVQNKVSERLIPRVKVTRVRNSASEHPQLEESNVRAGKALERLFHLRSRPVESPVVLICPAGGTAVYHGYRWSERRANVALFP